MSAQPVIKHRDLLHYVAIRTRVAMNDIPAILPPLLPKVREWLNQNNMLPGGAPFFRYLAMDEKLVLDVEVGFPVASPTAPAGEIIAGFFPAGSYAVLTHTGHYKHLREAHMQLDAFVKEQGWREDLQVTPSQEKRGVRTEFYINDPNIETNPDKWITEVVMLVARNETNA